SPLQHNDTVLVAAFSLDGRRVATATRDKRVYVWSADTGELLTISRLHVAAIADVRFVDASHVLAIDVNGRGWLWELPVDDRPIGDLQALAHLLSAGQIVPSGESD